MKSKKVPSAVLVVILILTSGFFLRSLFLSSPKEYVFDEVYFAKFASALTRGEYNYDIHPPLGKVLIGLGIRVFGDNFLGYRVMPMLVGTLFLLVVYLFARAFFENEITALIAFLIAFCEGTYLVYSRLSLLDIFMLNFGFTSLYFLVLYLKRERLLWLFLAGLFAGLTISIKWIGLGILACGFVFWLVFLQKKTLKRVLLFLVAFLVVPLLIYVASFRFVFKEDFWFNLKLWHFQSWNYNIHLSEGHPYGAKWWTWPLLLRPIWFYYKQVPPSRVAGILTIGNPLLWWLASLSVVYELMRNYRRGDPKVSVLLAGWAIFFLPWMLVSRVLFLYHYLFSSVFAYLILSNALGGLWQNPKSRPIAQSLLVLGFLVFLFFLPLWVGAPISERFYSWHILFRSWI